MEKNLNQFQTHTLNRVMMVSHFEHAHPINPLISNYLECYHSKAQIKYLKWKVFEFSSLNPRYREWTRYWEEYGKEYTRYWMGTVSHPTITQLRIECYAGGGGKKTVTEQWLNKVNELGLAVWYMDDGTLESRSRGYPVLNTQGFSELEHQLIQKYFLNKWNITVNIRNLKTTSKEGNPQFLTYIRASSKVDFFDIIREHIHPSMKYKIGE